MTIRYDGGRVVLEGECGVEDAESLLQNLEEHPAAEIDWSSCDRLHTAVVQVLMAAKRHGKDACGDLWLQRWIRGVFP